MKYILITLMLFIGCQKQAKDQTSNKDSINNTVGVPNLSAERDYSEKDINYRRKEHELLNRLNEKVWRNGDTLFIKLVNENIKKYINVDKDSGEDILYTFQGRLDGLDYYILHIQYYEGDQILLLNSSSGYDYYINAEPVTSPDLKFIATASFDLDAGYNPNELKIWRIEKDSLKLEFSLKPDEWGPSDIIWLNNNTIRFTKNVVNINDGNSLKRVQSLELKDSSWTMK